MSKSLNNFLMIKDILASCHPEAVRLFLLSSHYRSPIDFSDQTLKEAERALEKVYGLLKRMEQDFGLTSVDDATPPGTFWDAFCEAMDDDFNTARGIGHIFNLVKAANRIMDGDAEADDDGSSLRTLAADLQRMGGVLGIFQESWATFFENRTASQLGAVAIAPEAIDALVAERSAARKNKNWARADEIRAELESNGIVLEDKADGTHWKVAP
jgi:cysteinyl-tRNA synthetase